MISHNKILFYKHVYITASSLKIQRNTRIKVRSASLNYVLPPLGCMCYVTLFEYLVIKPLFLSDSCLIHCREWTIFWA